MTSKLPVEPSQYQSLSDLLAFSVRLGILEFLQSKHHDESKLSYLKELNILDTPKILPTWTEIRHQFRKHIAHEPASTPLGQFIQDYQLNESQLFIVFLLGEVETNHLIGLAVSELQSPDRDPRPSMHLVSSMLNNLFAEFPNQFSVIDIAQQDLVQHKLLLLHDEGPLAYQRLSISPYLYSVLINRKAMWPQCQPISDQSFPLTADTQEKLQLVVETFADREASSKHELDGILLRGNPFSGREQFAWYFALGLGLKAVKIPWQLWQAHPELAVLSRYAGWLPVLQLNLAPGETLTLPHHPYQAKVCIILDNDGSIADASLLEVPINLPTSVERQNYWQQALNKSDQENTFPSYCKLLAESALLSARSIYAIANKAQLIKGKQKSLTFAWPAFEHIVEARHQFSAEKLKLLAQPVSRRVNKDALVMPDLVEQTLNNIIQRTQKRDSLWQGLGSTLKATPNPGVRVLFVGESGTGKTLAASYVSTALAAPLYRVDLSSVMNKYIGESEKNLSQLLDYAAASDVVLLFDEADALFGSRTEGKETGERYANMLTNFLLTRIENHPGVVILTTNSRERIDSAFTRRIDMVVEFPLPGFEQRLHLWRSHLGDRGPGDSVYRTLASYCDLSGGQIRNAVLSAAVFAEQEKITEHNLIAGLRLEYQKIGRDLPGKVMQLTAA